MTHLHHTTEQSVINNKEAQDHLREMMHSILYWLDFEDAKDLSEKEIYRCFLGKPDSLVMWQYLEDFMKTGELNNDNFRNFHSLKNFRDML